MITCDDVKDLKKLKTCKEDEGSANRSKQREGQRER